MTVVDAFLRHVYAHHGAPHAIVSDRGSQWTDGFWARFCTLVGTERKLSTAFHRQTDGATERANQEVQAYLRAYIAYEQDDWDRWLPAAQVAINNRPNGNGPSPFFILHARDVAPIDIAERSQPGSKYAAAETLVDKYREIHTWVSAWIASKQQAMETQANRHRTANVPFRPGDQVWLDLRHITTGRPKKKLDWLHGKYTEGTGWAYGL